MKDVETSDIVLAAYLKVKGYKLDRITKDARKGSFWFSDVDDQAEYEFHLGSASVEPVSFNNALRALTMAVKRIL